MLFITDYLYDTTTLLSVLIGGILFYYWYKRPCSNFPPGPRGFPILGCIPFLGLRPEVKFLEYAKTYGNIFSVRIGRKEWVVLNDNSAINEAFVKKGAFTSDRPGNSVLDLSADHIGISPLQYNKTYKSQKSFGVSSLRGSRVGANNVEKLIKEEADHLSEVFRSKEGTAFDLKQDLSLAICNNIAAVVFGVRFEYDDPMFLEIVRITGLSITHPDTIRAFKVLTLVPFLQHFPPFRQQLNRLLKEIKKELGLFKELIDEHKKTFDENNIRDFADAFILKMKENMDSSFTDHQLLQYIRELFVAGTETSTATILWAILCLLHYPQTERKIYDEIEKVIGIGGSVTYAHKENMHYTSAFIEEVFRYRTLVPLSLPHAIGSDFKLGKFTLPKGTGILPNIWACHNNPHNWNEPEKFLPARHLNEKGEFVRSKNIIPFSAGPRSCLGEQIARKEVFIYIVSLIQKFTFEPDPRENTLPEINNFLEGLAFVPLPYKVSVKER